MNRSLSSNQEGDSSTKNNAFEGGVKLGPMEHFSASCLAGACMVALTNPLWLIKTRLQLQNSRLQSQLQTTTTTTAAAAAAANTTRQLQVKPPYRGAFHAAFVIIQEEGILALYKGSVPALMLVSHGGIQFMTYEFMKKHFALYVSNDKMSKGGTSVNRSSDKGSSSSSSSRKGTIVDRLRDSLGYLTMGAISKFVASTATYPLQVIKSRLQQRSQSVEVSEITGEIIVTKREYSGLIDCTTKIWRNEGVYGFFKGCITNALRVAPSAAVTFVTYEFVLDMLLE
jgi:solute carrier family 25 folate transporter 32